MCLFAYLFLCLFVLVEPFAATSLESDLFAASPPALEKDASVQARKALSLFDEEEEERLEDDGIKNAHKGNDVVSLGKFLNTGK